MTRNLIRAALLVAGAYVISGCDLFGSSKVMKSTTSDPPIMKYDPSSPSGCTFIGINAGAPVWDGKIAISADELAATGAGSVRLDFLVGGEPSWNDVALGRYDKIVDDLVAKGIEIEGLINYGAIKYGENKYDQAQWNDDPDGDGMNDAVVEFAGAAKLLMDRYGDRIKRWEIWNEPDGWRDKNPEEPNFDPQAAGGTYVLPRVYSKMLAETYVQAADVITNKSLEIVSGGLFAHDLGGSRTTGANYMNEVFSNGVFDWLESTYGKRYPWDYFGYHLYVDGGIATDGQKLTSYLDEMSQLRASHGDSTQFLITEIGWMANPSNADELELQKQNVQTAIDLLEARSDIAGLFWFTFRDFAEPWGIDGKPAAEMFAAEAAACDRKPAPENVTSCEHSPCAEGSALTKDCSPCANAVCASRAECCSSNWDAECVAIAADTPGACRGVCYDGVSACAHSECSAGDALDAGCSTCAQSMCERDSFCCKNEWDWICANEAERDPFCSCSAS